MGQNTAVQDAQQKDQNKDQNQDQNKELQREIRRHQNTLYVLGIGVIIFGLWTFARAFLSVVLEPVDESVFIESGIDEDLGRLSIFIILSVGYGIDILIRLWVGIKAIRAGNGTLKKKKFRLIGLGFLCSMNFIVIVIEAFLTYMCIKEQNIDSLTNVAIAALVDITTMFVLLQLKYAEIKLRKLLKLSLSG